MDKDFPILFNGQKYNINNFLRDHPGGVNTLKKYKGKSILQAMDSFGHSTSAYHMLNDFKIHGDFNDANLTGKVSANGRVITNEESHKSAKEIAFLEELEARLDWSKPLLSQLHLIAPHYELWVNSAVYRRCRLFASPLLESMTFTPWYLVPIFWIPVILYLGISQFLQHVACGELCTNESMSLLQFGGHLVFGLVAWTILEYSLHRWVFHLDPGSSLKMITVHFLIHGLHHKMPFDGLRQVFPPIPALVLATVIYVPFWLITAHPLIKMAGGLTGYLAYDMIHYYVHHGSPRNGSYLYTMKRYHSNHHFVNHDKAFGISSKIWDHIFKTYVHIRKLGFSLHWSS
ncbi:hypothetical protein evm_005222 [Chilo suppressalis]|nr:hypothetical protein evm_005222 [Chilo suppressalis]